MMKRFDEMTGEEILQFYRLLRTDPYRFLQLVEEYVRQYPADPDGYHSRADAWARLGHLDRAVEDLTASLDLEPQPVVFESRGEILRRLGRYQDAIEDFNRSEAMAPDQWGETFAPLYRADCYACLGNETAALADCAGLADNHWTPGIHDTPAGNKEAVITEIKRRARAARTQPA